MADCSGYQLYMKLHAFISKTLGFFEALYLNLDNNVVFSIIIIFFGLSTLIK